MNEIKAFAIGEGANVLEQDAYEELGALLLGFQKGLLPSEQINKVLRQSSFVAAAVADLVAVTLGADVLDDGDLDALRQQLADTITEIAVATTGALNYKGTWNAATNLPELESAVGNKGDLYTVSVAGSTDLDGIDEWNVGDKAVYNGEAWEKIEGQANEVISVAGRIGAVVLAAADVSDSTVIGRGILTAIDAAAVRLLLELGTAALSDDGDFDAAGAAATAAAAAQAAAIAASVPRTIPVDDGAANRDLSDADRGTFSRMTRATANTVTISAAVLAAAPADAEWSGIQVGTGQTTITPGVGVTLNATPGLKTRAQFSAWTIKKVDADEADVFGDLSA